MKPLRNMRRATWSRRTTANRLAFELDRLLLRAETCLDREDFEGAAELFGALKAGPWPELSFHLRAAEIALALGRDPVAEQHYRVVLAREPDASDALHGLGLVFQHRDDHRAMVDAWLRVRELDRSQPRQPWSIEESTFSEIAERAFEEIPESIRARLHNLPILVTDYPDEHLIEDGVDPRILGLFIGSPPSTSATPGIDCIHLFQRNIERMATNREELEREIRITVLHETAHYFGLEDDDLERLGLG